MSAGATVALVAGPRPSRRIPRGRLALRSAANDDELGMAWWNHMTRIERLEALLAADTVTPAEAWAHWKLRQSGART